MVALMGVTDIQTDIVTHKLSPSVLKTTIPLKDPILWIKAVFIIYLKLHLLFISTYKRSDKVKLHINHTSIMMSSTQQ